MGEGRLVRERRHRIVAMNRKVGLLVTEGLILKGIMVFTSGSVKRTGGLKEPELLAIDGGSIVLTNQA